MDVFDTLTVRTLADLDALNPYSRKARERFRAIEVRIPDLTPAEQTLHEERLNRNYFACGCREATIIGVIVAGLSIAWFVLQSDASAYVLVLVAIGGFFVGSGLGKMLGRLHARRLLRNQVRSLRHLLARNSQPAAAVRAAAKKCGCGMA